MLAEGHYLQKGTSKEEFCHRMEACNVHDPGGFRSRTKPYFKAKSAVIQIRWPGRSGEGQSAVSHVPAALRLAAIIFHL